MAHEGKPRIGEPSESSSCGDVLRIGGEGSDAQAA